MIQKTAATLLLFASLTTTALAQEHHPEPGKFYIVVKALATTAETIQESQELSISSDVGGGLGLDFGYTLPYNFALEIDTSYSKNSVSEKHTTLHHGTPHTQTKDATATYWTYAFDVTYTLPVVSGFSLLGKLGYEFEHESISDFNVNKNDHGVVYGAGVEYHLSEHYEALVEYESSTIESPRGSSIYAGIKYIF